MTEQTRPCSFIAKKDRTYLLTTYLQKETQAVTAAFLRYLAHVFPGAIWLMPPVALHITLYELMQRGDFGDKDALFAQNNAAWTQSLSNIFVKTEPMSLTFQKIVVSPDAITFQYEDGGAFNKLRARISNELTLPDFTKLPPDVVHCTVARFRKPISISDVERALRDYQLPPQTFTVNRFHLVKTSIQPMLEYEILHTFSLE